MISQCSKCSGTGWRNDIPCPYCNAVGKVSDRLFDPNLRS
jgi:hypothetical protein